jgi:hypothetical protein
MCSMMRLDCYCVTDEFNNSDDSLMNRSNVVSHNDENDEGMVRAPYVSYIKVDLPTIQSDVRTHYRV